MVVSAAVLGLIGTIVIAMLNPKLIKYLLIGGVGFILFTWGLFNRGTWILAIFIFLILMLRNKNK